MTPGKDGWVPPGAAVDVGRLTLPGGMLYVGRNLRSPAGHAAEPALIDPRLNADFRRPDWAGETVGYWPSYSDITPGARAAYLTWLAGGRQEPGVPISWVFLFFYGLERRVLVDANNDKHARRDLPAVRAEVERLLDLYGDNRSFRGYGTRFLDLVDFFLTDSDTTQPPARTGDRWEAPMSLRVALGEFAASGTPVPAEWALAWAHFHPEIYPRTPATRCPEEFAALFRARYAAKHGAGLTIRPVKTMLRLDYQAASAGIGQAEVTTDVSDVLTQAAPTKKLAALVEDCTNSLDAYSRYLGRNPEANGTLPALALLPPELLDTDGVAPDGEYARLMTFVDEALDQRTSAVVDADDVLRFWPTRNPDKLAKAEAVSLAQLLGARGVGIEPDVRLGGPVPARGTRMVLFRAAKKQPTATRPEYEAATLLLHLAAAVTAADGTVSDSETGHLADHLERSMHLTEPERLRLHAHLSWLLTGDTKLTGLTKRLATLGESQRGFIGDFLTTVAAADGHVSPEEIRILQRIYKLLELDPAAVYSKVHAATTGGLAARHATEPVTVRPATPGEPGYAIPPRPRDAADAAAVDSPAPTSAGVTLDADTVAARLAETAAVSALLGSIFTDDDEPATAPAAPAGVAGGPTVPGLDGPHSALLRTLAGRESWTRAELEAECAALGLLPDGALDTLNEAAYDTVGDPVVDGEDHITVDPQVAQEMQA